MSDPSREESEPSRPPGADVPVVVRNLCIALAFLLLLSLDPFGIQTASMDRSQEAALRITAPFYEPSGKVAVVVFDDAYLDDPGAPRTWPLPYAEHGRILRRLAQAGAATVFMDILFRPRADTSAAAEAPAGPSTAGPGDSPDAMLRPIRSFDQMPVFFATVARDRGDPALADGLCVPGLRSQAPAVRDTGAVRPDLVAAVEAEPGRLDFTLVSWWGCGHQYPLAAGGNALERTAALDLYRAWCRGPAAEPARCRLDERGEIKAADFAAPLVVQWGAFPPAEQMPFYAAGICQDPAPAGMAGLWHRVKVAADQLLLGVFEDLRDAPDPAVALPCAAVPVIPVSLLSRLDAEDLATLVQGRAVLVGARITGYPDWHLSPVHGQVPGVLLHAMALDNLLSLGPGYAREPGGLFAFWMPVLVLLAVAVLVPLVKNFKPTEGMQRFLVILGAVVWLWVAWRLAAFGQAGAALAALGIGVALDLFKPTQTVGYLLILLAMGGLTGLSLGWLGIAPGNWIALVLLGIGFAEALKPYGRRKNPKPFPHRESLFVAAGDFLQKLRQVR